MAAFNFNCHDGLYSEMKLEVDQRGEDVFLIEVDNRNLSTSYVPSEKDEAEYLAGLLDVMLSPTTAKRIANDLLKAAHKAENGAPY